MIFNKKLLSYSVVSISLLFVFLSAKLAPIIFSFLSKTAEHDLANIFFQIGYLFILSFIIFYTANTTKLPSFVVAIFFGIVAQPILAPIIHSHNVLAVLVSFGATLILFGGGLETKFSNFKKIFLQIFSLSFFGLLITSFLFSYILFYEKVFLGFGCLSW